MQFNKQKCLSHTRIWFDQSGGGGLSSWLRKEKGGKSPPCCCSHMSINVEFGSPLEKVGVEVEDLTRVCLTSWWAPEK